MVCEPDETDLDIQIPAVLLPQDAGASLEKMLSNSSSGKPFSSYDLYVQHRMTNLSSVTIYCSKRTSKCFVISY